MNDSNERKASANPYVSNTFGKDFVTPTETVKASKKGMKLGSKKNNNSSEGTRANTAADTFLNSMVQEDNLKMLPTNMKLSNAGDGVENVDSSSQPIQDVLLAIEEKVIAQITRDGCVNSLDVKGSLTFTATTENARKSFINMG